MAGRRHTPDVSVIITGHHEGDLCLPTLAALARSIEAATEAGVAVEVVGVLDRADESTAAVIGEALADGGTIGRWAPGRILTTDHGDPGAARNTGAQHAQAMWVCVLDGDNLPSRTWLRDAHQVASAHGAPCVVHPEQLVIFGARWQVWPQLPSDDAGFSVHNFFDRTYWDTFCMASREVFAAIPYAPTAAERGLGPEDWHWGMETVHAGFSHIVAPGTALLYRDKPTGSVQGRHDEARSLLPPSALLTDQRLAGSVPPDEENGEWRGLQASIALEHQQSSRAPTRAPAPAPKGSRWRQLLASTPRLRAATQHPAPITQPPFNVLHLRALHADLLRMSDSEAMAYFRDTGHQAGLRGALSESELKDVAAIHLADYAALHPDLTGLDDDALLHHYLAHGRAEGRAISRTVEERDASREVVLAQSVVTELAALHQIDPTVPAPTPENLAALRLTGPPSDGSTTAGSRAWWSVVDAIGPAPSVVVFVPQLRDGDSATMARVDSITSRATSERPVAVVATDEASARPTPPTGPGVDVSWVVLPGLETWRRLPESERRRLLATLVVQYQPAIVHDLDSTAFAAALSDYGHILGASTHIVGGSGAGT